MTDTARQRYLKRFEALKAERSSWLDHWKDLTDHIHPRRGRFLTSDANKGSKRNDKIVNSTPLRAHRILAAGMMTGLTSPARQWFRLTVPDVEANESSAVRSWLNEVERRMREVFARSNTYSALYLVYSDLGSPGTAVLHVEEDREDVIRAYVFPAGSYVLANSARLAVDAVYREFQLTVGQVVEGFGEGNVSDRVRELYRRNETEQWVKVLHVVERNTTRDPRFIDNLNMPWRSVWLELDAPEDHEGFLRRSGFEEFPAMAPRWSVTGEDVYGHCPGMDALGDCKALQVYEKTAAKLAAKLADPPMKGPSSLQHRGASLLPGSITYVDETSANARYEPAQIVDSRAISVIEEKVRQHENRINGAFFADLFLMLLGDERSNVTAEEIRARQQEKMLQLGPVLERLNDELLDPLIDRVFAIMERTGLLPPPPEELQGAPIRVEYTSVLAQAQKLLGTTSIERVLALVGSLREMSPEALDKIDIDKLIDTYAESIGVEPDLVRDAEAVAALRQQRQEQQQAQAQGAAMLAATQGVKNLATPITDDSALNRLAGALGPQAAAAVEGA